MSHCRLTVSISPEQDEALRDISRRSGFSASALTRAALERLIADPSVVFQTDTETMSAAVRNAPSKTAKASSKNAGSRVRRSVA